MSELRIAIDGPSGAGKSTLSRELSRRLGLPYVDTGAMYRAVAVHAVDRGASSEDEIVALLETLRMDLTRDPDGFRVRVDGVDVTDRLREPEVSERASVVAQYPVVRAWLVERQRREADGGTVMEGRDICSVVLPDAEVKLFVTASPEIRMQRRSQQLDGMTDADLHKEITERDRRDSERKASPLKVVDGAYVIDTGEDTVQESLERILEVVREVTG